ncbi:26S proteasome non-ATPase regulatory subunit 7 homolog A, partial [Tanacetum coccineum]
FVPNPVLVIIAVQPKELGIPTKAYYAIEEVKEKSQKVFVHVSFEIAAHEVEEIGVEYLLRDVKDTTISTLATEVTGKLAALKGLDARLKEIRGYLDLVIDGKLPLNHEILYHLQDHKDSISYNHEAQTRLRHIVDSSYKVDMDMCVESLELSDKRYPRD